MTKWTEAIKNDIRYRKKRELKMKNLPEIIAKSILRGWSFLGITREVYLLDKEEIMKEASELLKNISLS